jgi:nascent polypeptide-associated complex subunit alpha
MLPGMNPKQMQSMMRRMGIQQQEIKASEVIIRCEDSIIKITRPTVLKVNMMGQETFQINGVVSREAVQTAPEINDGDVQTVVDQTGVSKEKARKALEENEGDIARTIIQLKE